MGKLSSIMITLLMINIVGFIVVNAFGVGANPYIQENGVLRSLYSSSGNLTPTPGSTTQTFFIGENSNITGGVPTEAPDGFLQQAGAFIDRIFVLFKFVRVVLAFLFIPALVFSYALALPWELSLLLGLPLGTLYIVGLIDLLGGGDN